MQDRVMAELDLAREQEKIRNEEIKEVSILTYNLVCQFQKIYMLKS